MAKKIFGLIIVLILSISIDSHALPKKDIQSIEKEYAELKAELAKMKKESSALAKMLDKMNAERFSLKRKNEYLKRELEASKKNLKKERSKIYQELGDACVESKLYNQAIKAYLTSLNLNPDNAEAHYNLGLLYQGSQEDTPKAIKHLEKYLRFNPDAKNRKEAEYILNALRKEKISIYE